MNAEPPTPESPTEPVEPARRWWRQPRKLIAVTLAALVILGAAGAIAYNELKRPEDVSNEDVPFKEPVARKKPPKKAKDNTVPWPTFRYDRQRTGYLPVKGIKPPFKRIWKYGDKPLLEFPPAVVDGAMYFVDNDGYAHALKTKNGRTIWTRKIANLNAATPTYADGNLYIVNMNPGQVLALKAKNGKQIWKKSLPCRSESSPVVVHKRVYFGCEDGNVYAVKQKNGKSVWTTGVSGAVKGAPAYSNGTLFVGDYGGAMTAIRAKTGEVQWSTQALGPGLGQPGSFYSTPAVAYGRVYAGNNDSRVYSFDAKTGALAWTYSTGGYVYSGPSVAKVPGTPPTVYIGSFDGNAYALDAQSGKPRWVFDMGGRVIGSLSVIGRSVYAATFDGTTTYGISAKTGRKTFEFHSGAYMPGVSDGEMLYMVGYSSIHALKPTTYKKLRAEKKREAKAKAKRARKKAAATKSKAKAKAKSTKAKAKSKAKKRKASKNK